MRFGLIATLLLCEGRSLLCAQTTGNVRAIDFRNHIYPWTEREGWQSELRWLSTKVPNRITLVNGRWTAPESGTTADLRGNLPFAGVTLDEVIYADLAGSAKDDAVVVLREDTGGTQRYYLVYIYTINATSSPTLLAYFRSGDRSYQGLYRVFASGGKLTVDLYDPEKRIGDCCSAGFVRTRYRWDGHAFLIADPIVRGAATEWSRTPVSAFGMPYDQMKK